MHRFRSLFPKKSQKFLNKIERQYDPIAFHCRWTAILSVLENRTMLWYIYEATISKYSSENLVLKFFLYSSIHEMNRKK